jgi:hypothetical protein
MLNDAKLCQTVATIKEVRKRERRAGATVGQTRQLADGMGAGLKLSQILNLA